MVFSTESVAAMMLKKLQKTIAVANNGRSGGDVVVTVPGYWTDAQRRGLLKACDIAQVKCVGLVNENTATALNYGIWKNVKGEFTEEKIYVLSLWMLATVRTQCHWWRSKREKSRLLPPSSTRILAEETLT